MINLDLAMTSVGFTRADQIAQFIGNVKPELRIKKVGSSKYIQVRFNCDLSLLKNNTPEIVVMRYRSNGKKKKWCVDAQLFSRMQNEDFVEDLRRDGCYDGGMQLSNTIPEYAWQHLLDYEKLRRVIYNRYTKQNENYPEDGRYFKGAASKKSRSCRFAVALRIKNPYYKEKKEGVGGQNKGISPVLFSQKEYMTFRTTHNTDVVEAGVALVQD